MSTTGNSTTGQSIRRDADTSFPWWAMAILALVTLVVLAALVATIVLCWHYHNEHEAGDARAGNMEQCVESVQPFPQLSSVDDSSRRFSRLRLRSGHANDGHKNRRGSTFTVAEPLFSNARRLASLEAAFHEAQ